MEFVDLLGRVLHGDDLHFLYANFNLPVPFVIVQQVCWWISELVKQVELGIDALRTENTMTYRSSAIGQ